MALTATGCEPSDGEAGGVSAIGVAVTTDKLSTRALEHGGIGVRWLTCNGERKHQATAGVSATPDPETSVDCRGRTEDDREIRVTGTVTHERANTCVQGDLKGTVDGHQVFRADHIGDCGG
ncbi:hypothetical protein NKH77_17965 [Streptomyces sp. M19]